MEVNPEIQEIFTCNGCQHKVAPREAHHVVETYQSYYEEGQTDPENVESVDLNESDEVVLCTKCFKAFSKAAEKWLGFEE